MKSIATFQGPEITGFVLFENVQQKRGSKVVFKLNGFKPNTTHAIHIHEYGDLRNGCKSLGGHWNAHNKNHGSIWLDKNDRHSGDLINNLKSDDNGNFYFDYYDPLIKVSQIVGRSVVIHEEEDDLGRGSNKESLISGNAGKRKACAIIGITSL